MISLKIKLSLSELSDLAQIVPVLLTDFEKELTIKNYFHFYNVRSFCKKLIDKMYSSYSPKTKQVALSININEFESLLHLTESRERALANYYEIQLNSFLAKLDRARMQVATPGIFLH
jgi:hypothetical protein